MPVCHRSLQLLKRSSAQEKKLSSSQIMCSRVCSFYSPTYATGQQPCSQAQLACKKTRHLNQLKSIDCPDVKPLPQRLCTTYAIGNVCVQHGVDIHTMAPSSEFLAHSTEMGQLENPYMTHMHNYSMQIPAPTITHLGLNLIWAARLYALRSVKPITW